MRPDKLRFAHSLVDLIGWNQTFETWTWLLQVETWGCLLGYWKGLPVGTVATIRYENKMGWVCMLLVHPQMQRRGIGSGLLGSALTFLDKHVPCVKMDANPEAVGLYERNGFVPQFRVHRWKGEGKKLPAEKGCYLVTKSATIQQIAVIDKDIFGYDREMLLEHLFELPEAKVLVSIEEGEIAGYLFYRKGHKAWQIGPWISDGDDIARKLLHRAISTLPEGQPFVIDVPETHGTASEMVEATGAAVEQEFVRMLRGPEYSHGLPAYIYATAGPEYG